MKVIRRIAFILLAVLFGIVVFLALLAAALLIADTAVDASARVLPSYAREDISALLEKESWTEEDYRTLYLQTGLGRSALDEMQGDAERILEFQDALYYEGELAHEEVAITTKRDIFADASYRAPIVDLQNGDVLVTSTCHSFGWRNGHAALVVNARNRSTLESVSLGVPSVVNTYGDDWFRYGTNFMVLRLKDADESARDAIAQTALERLGDALFASRLAGVSLLRLRHRLGRRAHLHRAGHCAQRPVRSRAGIRVRSRGTLVALAKTI